MSFVFHLGPSLLGGYGYFIDELYYVACAKRLAWGYVDHPPFSLALLRVSLELFGDSVGAVRLFPAMAGGMVAALAAGFSGKIGGGKFAQALTATAVTLAPVMLVFFDVYSMNAFEIVLWTSLVATLVLLVERKDPRLWLAFGAVSGVALLNKHTVVLLGLALVLGVLLTPHRRLLMSPWLLAGGAIAFVIFLPNVWWQAEHGFPSLEFYRNASLLKNRPLPAWHVIWNQLLIMNPLTFPLWGAGLLFMWRLSTLRPVVWAYLFLLAVLVATASSRPDRIAGLYPVLIAAGAVAFERQFARLGRTLVLGIAAVSGLLLAPVFAPILPPPSVARYVAFLGLDLQIERGEGKRAALPQWLADRFGWPEIVEDVEEVYRSLPQEERATTTLLAPSYGHAGAIELLGRDLPQVVSPHNSYYLWGRPDAERLSRGVVVSIGYGPAELSRWFDEVERVAVHRCEYCMPWRNEMGIYVARGAKLTPAEALSAWDDAKHYE